MSDNLADLPTMIANKPVDITYPLSKKLNINFSAYEDRLLVKAERIGIDDVTLLMTRRMTMLVLQQVLSRLPELSGLDKTPAAYWQEVLQMSHQGAMEAKTRADKAESEQKSAAADAEKAANADKDESLAQDNDKKSAEPSADPKGEQGIYLATELTVQVKGDRLTLAFRGLQMPDAMTKASQHVPVLAIPLSLDNVHQLIELFITKAREANWHMPVDLPWLESPKPVSVPADGSFRTH
ncbi:hypothetical protein E3V39_04870 [Gammaproteobacteria bacterium LSUCC0112]|nr:hypothetical protein E3V39_04870 [Gammaproteobacteria bacterium LSUCC0112]